MLGDFVSVSCSFSCTARQLLFGDPIPSLFAVRTSLYFFCWRHFLLLLPPQRTRSSPPRPEAPDLCLWHGPFLDNAKLRYWSQIRPGSRAVLFFGVLLTFRKLALPSPSPLARVLLWESFVFRVTDRPTDERDGGGGGLKSLFSAE